MKKRVWLALALSTSAMASNPPLSGTFSNVQNPDTGGFTTRLKNKINLIVTTTHQGQQFFIQCFKGDEPGFGVVTVIAKPAHVAKIAAGPECPASQVQVELDYDHAAIRIDNGWVYLPRADLHLPLARVPTGMKGETSLAMRAKFSSEGLSLREEFRIAEYCAYQVDLRLKHRKMNELNALLPNDRLPLALTVKVYRFGDDRAKPLAEFDGSPRVYGRGVETTSLNIGNMRLDAGRYLVEVTSKGAAPQLAGVEVELAIQQRPKTVCPRKET